jgi:hypothetical protein
MKTFNIALLSLALAAGLVAANSAEARGGRHHHGGRVGVGVFIGAPLFPYYYSPYYYPRSYYPPAVVVPSQPLYIEQGGAPAPASAAPAPATQNSGAFWYYCRDSQTYYPYVQQCPSPWEQVMPQASASTP